MGTFKQSIASIGSLLLVVDAWDNPAPLKRAWYAAGYAHAQGGARAVDALFAAGAYWNCTQLR
jgi:hypothetical protein